MRILTLLFVVLSLSACGSRSSTKTVTEKSGGSAGIDTPNLGTDRTNCKRGGAYGYHSSADLDVFGKRASWWYNWASKPDEDVRKNFQDFGIEFVPMVWNGTFEVENVIADIPEGSKYLLAFNEPNFKSQANLSPTEAAALWPKIEQIADAKNLKIVGPGVNYCGPAADCHETDPYVYLDKFFATCTNCQVDYLNVHWYACKGEYLTDYLKKFAKYNRPLWVTEFACGDGNDEEKSASGQSKYMAEALAILEKDPNVFRYAWFSSRTTVIPNVDLFVSSGNLSSLGEEYLSFPTLTSGVCDR